MSSCCSGRGFGLPSFPVSDMYILCLISLTCPHIRLKWSVNDLMLQWLWCWFALISRLLYILCLSPSWCPHIRFKWLVHDLTLQWLWCWFAFISRLSDICSAFSFMISSYSSFYDDVLYILLLYRFVLNIVPSWKRWVELKLVRAGHRRQGSTRSERRKRKHTLGGYGRDCRRSIWRGLPEHDSGDIELCGHKAYICTTCLLYTSPSPRD